MYLTLWHFIKVKSWDKVLAYSRRNCGFEAEQSHKPWEELNVGSHNMLACGWQTGVLGQGQPRQNE